MNYICVQWHHENQEDPIELYSELDDNREEIRKVEVFRDGHMQFADEHSQAGDTFLSVEPIPSLADPVIAWTPKCSATSPSGLAVYSTRTWAAKELNRINLAACGRPWPIPAAILNSTCRTKARYSIAVACMFTGSERVPTP